MIFIGPEVDVVSGSLEAWDLPPMNLKCPSENASKNTFVWKQNKRRTFITLLPLHRPKNYELSTTTASLLCHFSSSH
jgi:hypothetical protein